MTPHCAVCDGERREARLHALSAAARRAAPHGIVPLVLAVVAWLVASLVRGDHGTTAGVLRVFARAIFIVGLLGVPMRLAFARAHRVVVETGRHACPPSSAKEDAR